ncbi:MAG: hypothetical protein ACRCW5_10950 [Cetobacterium sp.]
MFTIEALNRIEGFVWPERASHAFMNEDERFVSFTSGRRPDVVVGVDKCMYTGVYAGSVSAWCKHSDWRSSLITREEFESVDGWVRNDGKPPVDDDAIVETIVNGEVDSRPFPADGIEWGGGGCVSHWRYHKPQKQEVKPEPESNASNQSESQEGIESLISKHKAVKEIARMARIELERAEAAEHSLMLSIETWAESHGFDIRVLSESEEKQELVITDFGDLRIGDEIECIHPVGGFISPGDIGVVTSNDGELITADFDKQSDYVYGDSNFGIKFKFIRRPEKK